MKNRELGSTKNYLDSLPAPEPIGPCTPIRAGGGNFTYFNNVQGNAPVNINPPPPSPGHSGDLGFICLAIDLIHQ